MYSYFTMNDSLALKRCIGMTYSAESQSVFLVHARLLSFELETEQEGHTTAPIYRQATLNLSSINTYTWLMTKITSFKGSLGKQLPPL